MRLGLLATGLLLIAGDACASNARDLLAAPNPLRNRPGVTSTGPASAPNGRPSRHDGEPAAQPTFDPFAVQTAFKSIADAAGLEPVARETGGSTLAILATASSTNERLVNEPMAPPTVEVRATPSIAPEALPSADNAVPIAELEEAPALSERNETGPNDARPAESATTDAEPHETTAVAEPRRLSFSAAAPTDTPAKPLSLPDPLQALAGWNPTTESLVTTGSGLALVVGLLMLTAWTLRKAQPRSARPLPKEVAEVLGRAPLGGRAQAQLLRLGNKLVLVSVAPDHAETLCEITDESEVARLRAICDQPSGGSAAAFEDLFGQMADAPAEEGFLGGGYDPQRLADAYANTPGGRRYA
ncbi:MAG: flagellar biosynthetic protein FliO [Planctomycetota bacterium]